MQSDRIPWLLWLLGSWRGTVEAMADQASLHRTWLVRTALPVQQAPLLQSHLCSPPERCLQAHRRRVAPHKVALLGTCLRLVGIRPPVLTAGDSPVPTRCGQEGATPRVTRAPQLLQARTVAELDPSPTLTPAGGLAAAQVGQAATGVALSMMALHEEKAVNKFGSPSLVESLPWADCLASTWSLRSARRLQLGEAAFERLLAWANLVLWFLWAQMLTTWHQPWLPEVQRTHIILMGIAVAAVREGIFDLVDGDEKDLHTGTLLRSMLGVAALQVDLCEASQGVTTFLQSHTCLHMLPPKPALPSVSGWAECT